MDKKTSSTILGILFLIMNAMMATANSFGHGPSSSESISNPYGTEVILLQGTLAYGGQQNNIEAYFDNNCIVLQFYQDYGYVSITLTNTGTGALIYSSVVNTAVQQTVIIPITGAPSGSYTLVLENANGYAEGEFEKN